MPRRLLIKRLITFFSRARPAANRANPGCIKSTRAEEKTIQIKFRLDWTPSGDETSWARPKPGNTNEINTTKTKSLFIKKPLQNIVGKVPDTPGCNKEPSRC